MRNKLLYKGRQPVPLRKPVVLGNRQAVRKLAGVEPGSGALVLAILMLLLVLVLLGAISSGVL